MYCIIMNYNTASLDVIELPYSDFWEESSIEEYAQYNLKDCYYMLTDKRPELDFLNV